ncbi:hypothetical protein ACSBR2_017262 [Camellia fascicularis]
MCSTSTSRTRNRSLWCFHQSLIWQRRGRMGQKCSPRRRMCRVLWSSGWNTGLGFCPRLICQGMMMKCPSSDCFDKEEHFWKLDSMSWDIVLNLVQGL